MKISITVEGHLKVFLHLFITNETAHILISLVHSYFSFSSVFSISTCVLNKHLWYRNTDFNLGTKGVIVEHLAA